jgi:hypothetical protein
MYRCEIDYVLSHGHATFTYGEDGLDTYEDKESYLMAEGEGATRLDALRNAVDNLLAEGLAVREAELRRQADDEWSFLSHEMVDEEMTYYREAVDSFLGEGWTTSDLLSWAFDKPLRTLKNGTTRWQVYAFDPDAYLPEESDDAEGLALLAA